MIARLLMRLALKLGAVPPSRVMLMLRVGGRTMVILHDEQAHHVATMNGGGAAFVFRVTDADETVALELQALDRPRK